MNKYQEALEFLRSEDVTAWGNDKIELLYLHLDNIEELVDKSTLKERIIGVGYDDIYDLKIEYYTCPNCGCYIDTFCNFCSNCGQAIEAWSDEDVD